MQMTRMNIARYIKAQLRNKRNAQNIDASLAKNILKILNSHMLNRNKKYLVTNIS